METKTMIGGALAGLILTTGVVGAVSAQTAAEMTTLTEEEVIEIALMEVPGEVLEVELEEERGQAVYEVAVLTADGAEMEVEIAADTGDVLEVEAEDADDREGCDKNRDA